MKEDPIVFFTFLILNKNYIGLVAHNFDHRTQSNLQSYESMISFVT